MVDSSTWQAYTKSQDDGRVLRYQIAKNNHYLTYGQVIFNWIFNRPFCSYFNELLASAPFKAYKLETPWLTAKTSTHEFEFTLLEIDFEDRLADWNPFAKHFKSDSAVSTLPNSERDTIIVAPLPELIDPVAYLNLASFVRDAPESQQQEFWGSVGAATKKRVSNHPFWLSSSGLEASWVHIRLDDEPKHYCHLPYKECSLDKNQPEYTRPLNRLF
ncbi:hypothetical protein N9Y42_02660 [Mariniblastus sp.]|nr:hypothetical protein [Mariniblastus sp.]